MNLGNLTNGQRNQGESQVKPGVESQRSMAGRGGGIIRNYAFDTTRIHFFKPYFSQIYMKMMYWIKSQVRYQIMLNGVLNV